MNELIRSLYWFCTDFCINSANLLGISYEEFNAILFLFLMPGFLLLLLGANGYRYLLRPLLRKTE